MKQVETRASWSDESSFTLRKSLRLENTKRSLQSGIPCCNNEIRRTFCDGLGSNIMVQYFVGPIITLHGRITVREYMDKLGDQVHPMIQSLFPKNDAVFQENMKVNFSIFPGHHNHQI
jgi:hypothetical protein